MKKKLAQKRLAIGLETLWLDEYGQYWIEIHNRTYRRMVPIPEEKVAIWKTFFGIGDVKNERAISQK
jgi:hypothetical protein